MTKRQPTHTPFATSWGHPRTERSPAFHRVVGRWFAHIATVCRYATYGLAAVALALTVYATLFVEHVQAFASDGTVFSCELPIIRASQ
ncbi:MAG: hypothetical protein ACN6OP_03750 [Pseudomonadales bacterium]